jgi:hypothetical protein
VSDNRQAVTGQEVDVTKKTLGWVLVGVAASLAVSLVVPARRRRYAREEDCARIDEASDESFPASDPPSHSSPTASAGPA